MLDELYVAPASRGRGIGSALLDRVHAEMRERDVELVEVNVSGDEPGEDESLLYYYREMNDAASA